MSRWLLNLLFTVLLLSILAAVPLAYRAYEPVQKNNQAVEALRNKHYDEAIALLSDAMRNSPENRVFRQNLVAAYNSKAIDAEKTTSNSQALGWYEKALELDPENQTLLGNYITSLNNRAVEFSNSGRFTDSQALFERAGKRLVGIGDRKIREDIRRNYSVLLTLWGAELMKRDQFDGARTTFQQSLDLDPKNPTSNILLGDLFYEVNRYEEARKYYSAALPLDAKNANYLKNRLNMIEDEVKVEGLFTQGRDAKGRFSIQYVEYGNGVKVPELLSILGAAYDEIGQVLGIYPARAVNVKIYNSKDFYRISRLPEWAIGIFDGKMRLKVEDVQSGPAQVRDLLFHEYTHAVLAMNVKQQVPAWFHEGLAQLMEPQFAENPREQSQMRDALARKELSFESLKESFKELGSRQDAENAYLLSKYFLANLNRRHGKEKLREWVGRLAKEEKFDEAFAKVYGMKLDTAQENWIRAQVRQ